MRRAGGQSAGGTLSENPRFQMMEKDHFQGSLIHGWIQFPPILQAIKKEVARNFPPPDTANNPLAAYAAKGLLAVSGGGKFRATSFLIACSMGGNCIQP